MWTRVVESATLLEADRWTVSYFAEMKVSGRSAHRKRPLRDLAVERRSTIDPQQHGDEPIVYLGLENVRPTTGELVDFALRPASSIKSRSKTFQAGDVLYGRLRPELNKVYLAQSPAAEGMCSCEFIVLAPRQEVVLPRYLRHILASSFVTQFAGKLTVGASLPRMSPSDLLGIEVPVPPLAVQARLVEQLARIDQEIVALRARLAALPAQQAEGLLVALSTGRTEIEVAMAA
ncbi:MAG: hypothetical protein U1E80_10025 [Piscinibacter sp.]|uniref:hypothetical protein n=1 Tax=Piscinibacter sp. TaxID=1903157 RepID=UPI0035B23946